MAVVLLGIVGLTIGAALPNNVSKNTGATGAVRSQRSPPPTTRPALTDGLVSYWKLDDGQGKLVTDSSANGNHGVLLGNPRWIAGKSGGALNFAGEGSKDAVQVRHSPSLDLTGPMTITAWVWPETKTGVQTILSRNLGAAPRGYTLRINWKEEGGRVEFLISSDGKKEESVTASTPIPTGNWSHWAGVFASVRHATDRPQSGAGLSGNGGRPRRGPPPHVIEADELGGQPDLVDVLRGAATARTADWSSVEVATA